MKKILTLGTLLAGLLPHGRGTDGKHPESDAAVVHSVHLSAGSDRADAIQSSYPSGSIGHSA